MNDGRRAAMPLRPSAVCAYNAHTGVLNSERSTNYGSGTAEFVHGTVGDLVQVVAIDRTFVAARQTRLMSG